MHNDMRDSELMQTLSNVLNNYDPSKPVRDEDLVMFSYRMIEFSKVDHKKDPSRRKIVLKVNKQKRDAKLAEMNRNLEKKNKEQAELVSRKSNTNGLNNQFE